MSVKIRLSRIGTKKRPMYRLVVTDSRAPRDSSNIEIVGHYNPNVKPRELKIDQERIDHWLKKGAQPSETVRTLIKRANRKEAPSA